MLERHERNGYVVSSDPKRLDAKAVKAYLDISYWAKGRPLPVVKKSLRNSLCFGLYRGREQIGLARVITDRATYAYLCDVYIHPDHQGGGLGKWLMSCVMGSRELKGVRGWCLKTTTAHGLYRRFGFRSIPGAKNWMRLRRD